MSYNSFDEMHPSRFMKASDLDGKPQLLTISGYTGEQLGDDIKPVAHFKEAKPLILNRVNKSVLKDLYGAPAQSIGKQIVAYPDRTPFRGEMVDCVRLRAPRQVMRQVVQDAASAAVALNAPPVHITEPTGEPAANFAELDDEIPF